MRTKDIKVGDKLVADGSSPCLQRGTVVEVFQHQDDGTLAVRCKIGAHFLRDEMHGDVEGFSMFVEPVQKREEF